MAFITYPLNNIDYTAEDAELFHCTRTSGIWAEDSFPISVTGADNNVTIGKGIAWINNKEFSGKVTALKSAKIIDLGVADGVYPRIDVIAIQFNANNNATDVIIKKGTPATSPVRPTIVRTGAIYELYLASVYRPAGAISITAGNITDLRMDETVCGLMADSVTKVDMTTIEAQIRELINNLQGEIDGIKDLSGLMFETEWTEDGVISVPKGGTGAATVAAARQNLNYMGTNPIASKADDTPVNWAALGTGVAYFNGSGKLNNQPTAYGFVENIVAGNLVYQTFYSMNGNSPVWHRSGTTTSGWYLNSANWVKSLDENNGIQIKKLWENASPTSSFATQTITVETMREGDFVAIESKTQHNSNVSNIQMFKIKAGLSSQIIHEETAGDGGDPYFTRRSFDISQLNKIIFGNGYYRYVNAKNIENDNYAIPAEIYLVKGVS